MLTLSFGDSERTTLVRYRSITKDQPSMEHFLEAPIRNLSTQCGLQNGSYVISNRGMEWFHIYNRLDLNRESHLVNLPMDCMLQILSHLDAKSLCMVSRTCKVLQRVSLDELLWKQRLKYDSQKWSIIGHLSHPAVYEAVAMEMGSKNIYKRCTLERIYKTENEADVYSSPLSKVVTLWNNLSDKLAGRSQVVKVLMFGKGLDHYALEKKLLFDSSSPYHISCLYPGHEGFGSGVGFKHKGSQFNLVTMYSSTWSERRAAINGQGPLINKLVSVYNEGEQNPPDLTQSVQELCPSAKAYILVVNAEQSELLDDQQLLKAFVKYGSKELPVLVVSCHKNFKLASNALEVADKLALRRLSNPWQVLNLSVEHLCYMSQGFDWLTKTLTL